MGPIHTPAGLIEKGVRTLKEIYLTNLRVGENYGNALDLALDAMRKTPQKRQKRAHFTYTTVENSILK